MIEYAPEIGTYRLLNLLGVVIQLQLQQRLMNGQPEPNPSITVCPGRLKSAADFSSTLLLWLLSFFAISLRPFAWSSSYGNRKKRLWSH